ncbi:MAG TPA: HAMP domain-containing sensor histidine kinase [Paraburkholderia sp.]|uniref:sensor histidine kinase n=1 Tax=Paraburkholderia sp. TaxID=1926495 RepID=UPI002ED26488
MTTSSTGSTSAQPVSSGFAVSERTAHLRAETALFMRDYVLGLASHDLRGPLNAIHSWAYVLERKLDANDPNSQRAITGIRNGVDQQVKLLESIVDATRAETRSLALTYAPFPLHPLLDETAEEVRSGLARMRGVEVVVHSQLATEQLNGDRERLAQALWVMLTFAVEASLQGATVTLTSRADATSWHTAVTYETSAAPDDSTLPHVLEAFALKQAREPREANRIAWVLALCKRVAEAHGGGFEQTDASENAPSTLALRVPFSAPAAR